MATSFTDIFDRFTMLENDYRLIALYESSPTNFTTYLTGWLILAIDEFNEQTTPNQSLAYNESTKEFTEDLNSLNQTILARIMTRYWLEKLVNDTLQMEWNIQGNDFKHYAESKNTEAKKALLESKKEEISQIFIDYGYNNIDWATLSNPTFS